MKQVDAASLSPLAAAARAGDVAAVRRLLDDGANVEGEAGDPGAPLWQACASDAPAEARLAIVDALLVAGANPRRDATGETALHAAAARGPLALVERLIVGNALEWQTDRKGRWPLAVARRSKAADKAAIVAVLDRDRIDDPSFRAAVKALQRGDAARLGRLIDAEPRLLRERILGPEAYRKATRFQYFRDPKLFWFIANNPTLMKRMPDNMVEVAETMIARGVEQADLDYALELVMTSALAREQGLQGPLIACLAKAGAVASPQAIDRRSPIGSSSRCGAAGRRLADDGGDGRGARRDRPPAGAAGRGLAAGGAAHAGARRDQPAERGGAAGARRRRRSQRLPAGACPQPAAAPDGNRREYRTDGAAGRARRRTDVPDKLWGTTPLDWAIHQNKARSRAWLEGHRPE